MILARPPTCLPRWQRPAPDGQVCGRFVAAQVARPHLRPRLRRFLVALVLVVGLGMSAQEALAQVRRAKGTPAQREVARREQVFGMVVEKMPEYKAGGLAGAHEFIQQEVRYPAGATKAGRVFVKFVVDKQGHPKNFEIAKGLEPLLDAEALRATRLIGDFTPGLQNGQPVEVSFVVPVTFSLK